MICLDSFFRKLRQLVSRNRASDAATAVQEGNPWQTNLERLAIEHGAEAECAQPATPQSVEEQFQLLIEQARMEKTKETLRKQQEILQNGGKRRRAQDQTVTDAKAWWGQSVVTWDPEDSKNMGMEDRRHPKKAKWFNQ